MPRLYMALITILMPNSNNLVLKTVVTPSNWLKRLIKQSFLSSYPVAVINNGIDTNVFKHTESNLREVFGLNNKFIISIFNLADHII